MLNLFASQKPGKIYIHVLIKQQIFNKYKQTA